MISKYVFAGAALMASLGLAFDLKAAPLVDAFRSHLAVYEMTQIEKEQLGTDAPYGVRGLMRYRFIKGCEVFDVNHETYLEMNYPDQDPIRMAWRYTSQEESDGRLLRFRSQTERNGTLISNISGVATHGPEESIVAYTAPEKATFELDPDTYFPTHHLLNSLQAAREGERVYNARYFDGSSEDTGLQVSTVTLPFRGVAMQEVNAVTLPDVPVWLIQMSFRKPDETNALPDMEIGARYREDGIATSLTQDFGNFMLRGQLVELEYLPDQACP